MNGSAVLPCDVGGLCDHLLAMNSRWVLWVVGSCALLVAIVAGLTVPVVAHAAGASFPVPQVWTAPNPPGTYPTRGAAFEAFVRFSVEASYSSYPSFTRNYLNDTTFDDTNYGLEHVDVCNASGQCDHNLYGGRVYAQAGQCPSGSTPSGSSCTCDGAATPDGNGACAAPACPTAGQSLGVSGPGVYDLSSLSTSVCIDGCGGTGVLAAENAGRFSVWGPFTSSGSRCVVGDGTAAASPAPPTQAQLDPLKPGECRGTFNGATIVVPCGKTQAPTQSASSGASAVSPSASGTVPYTASFDAVTTCVGGKCVTTSIDKFNNADGTTTTAKKDTTTDKGTFCADNPGSPLCDKAAFGGSCAATTCTGDAVQCAIAQQAAKFDCTDNLLTPEQSAAVAVLKGSGPAEAAFAETFDLGTHGLAPPPTGCAVSDVVVELGGMSLALPLGTYLCDKLAMIRAVVVAFGSLLFIMIVGGLRGS